MTSPHPLVSVVVLGYRRPGHLRRTIESFLRVNSYQPIELILSDDGSSLEEQRQMKTLPFDRFLLSPRNRGLGASTNAALAAARGQFILQLQDDWLCEGAGDFIEIALDVIRERPDIALVRLAEVRPEPSFVRWVSREGKVVRVYGTPPQHPDIFVYTDTPHLKTREYVDFIGPYRQSRYTQRTELDMRDRFNAQSRYRAAYVEGYCLFHHIGADRSFNRPLPLTRLGFMMDRSPVLRGAARLYRAARRSLRGQGGG